jgi:ketosteroid isomerase-like protein
MSETEDFLAATMPRQKQAETALHNGDAGLRLEMWSPNDPVTLFGALQTRVGWEDVSETFRWVATRFADCSSYEIELMAAGASGELAYTVAYEHTTASVEGKPPVAYTLRVTHVYRREDGQWRVVHRHADTAPQRDA